MSARSRVQQLARESYDRGDPIGWFEQVYKTAKGDEAQIPWASLLPSSHLTTWLRDDYAEVLENLGEALVIAAGLGDDAELLAGSGLNVTAFDISKTAVEWARKRFADSTVEYVVENLFQPPDEWKNSFNFVFETQTLQALPWKLRAEAVRRISSFVSPGGTLLVVTLGRGEQEEAGQLPWPLAKSELDAFKENGMNEIRFVDTTSESGRRWFVVTYQKPAEATA